VWIIFDDPYHKRLNLGDLEDSAERLNALYGGLSPTGTQVVYTIGELDPWHTLGNHQGTPESPVIVIEGITNKNNQNNIEKGVCWCSAIYDFSCEIFGFMTWLHKALECSNIFQELRVRKSYALMS
jgi:hypothetical protein